MYIIFRQTSFEITKNLENCILHHYLYIVEIFTENLNSMWQKSVLYFHSDFFLLRQVSELTLYLESYEKTASQVSATKSDGITLKDAPRICSLHHDNQLSKQRTSCLWRRPSDLEGLDCFQ